jgi:hypothetical protein
LGVRARERREAICCGLLSRHLSTLRRHRDVARDSVPIFHDLSHIKVGEQRAKEKGIEKRHNPLEFQPSKQSSKHQLTKAALLGNDIVAEIDALVADINLWAGDQLSHFVVALTAK